MALTARKVLDNLVLLVSAGGGCSCSQQGNEEKHTRSGEKVGLRGLIGALEVAVLLPHE